MYLSVRSKRVEVKRQNYPRARRAALEKQRDNGRNDYCNTNNDRLVDLYHIND